MTPTKNNSKIKALIKESVKAALKEDNVFGPPMTAKERNKDKLQTVMLDAARKFLKNHFMEDLGPLDTRGQRQKLMFAYSELEDILVDAMMGWNLPASRDTDDEG